MTGVDLDTPLDEEALRALVDSVARKVVDRGLEAAAVLFLEMYKPLSFLVSQSLMVGMPFLSPFVGAQRVADISKALKDRENIEVLVRRIEDVAAEKDKAKNAALES
jgi:hypothetical protein